MLGTVMVMVMGMGMVEDKHFNTNGYGNLEDLGDGCGNQTVLSHGWGDGYGSGRSDYFDGRGGHGNGKGSIHGEGFGRGSRTGSGNKIW
jgi:hypothetical protein